MRKQEKLTPNQRDEIAIRYAAGESSTKLAENYGVSVPNVLNLVRHRKIKIRSGYKLDQTQWENVSERYRSGEKPINLAKEFGVKSQTIIQIAKRFGVPLRGIWESRGRYKINHDAFAVPTPEGCYWAGFLMADGYINDKRNQICLTLAKKDKDHVEKFKKFLGSQHKIIDIIPQKIKKTSYVSQGACGITFTSKKIISDLSKFGITPRKSHTAKIIGGFERDRDFWRGVIDGDGSVSISTIEGRRYAHISLVGSQFVVQQFCDFVKFINPECHANIRKDKSIFAFSTKGKFAVNTIKFIYENSNVYLERKYKKAIASLTENNSPPHARNPILPS